MLLKRLLISTLIISHLLINCAWAVSHIGDGNEQGYQCLHVHAHHHDTDTNHHNSNTDLTEDNNHDEGCHIHLVCQVSADNTLHILTSGQQTTGHYQLDYRSLAEQPPVPPPTA